MTDAVASRAETAVGPEAAGAATARARPPPSQPPGPGAARVSVVHDLVPGRLRLQVEGLKGSAAAARRLERALARLDRVLGVRASPLTGTVLVLSDRTKALGEKRSATWRL